MKKFLAIIMTICLLASTLCITVFAAESTSVIKVHYGSETKTFENFEDGWNFAMEEANDGKEVYATLLTDWIADDGRFSDDFINGDGFDNDTIYFADDVTVTLDLGGHTIDRGRLSKTTNGEVIFINDDANVTIKNGTIKGGYSINGAGGIHVEDANVKLIDLVITNNHVLSSNGTAIYHDGGELYMKNCRIVDNDGSKFGLDIYGADYLDGLDKVLIEDCNFADNDDIDYGAGIHAEDCNDFVIKNTTFENLHADDRGGAIWIGDSKLYIYNCKFNNNSCGNYGGAIYSDTAELYVYDTEFKGNYSDWDGGAVHLTAGDGMESGSVPSCFYRCTFDGNCAGWDGGAIYCDGSFMGMLTNATTYGCDFINNSAGEDGGAVCTNSDCRFGFFSDKETGKAGTMKNNSAGELGGGFYQGDNAPFHFGGEIYASGNISSAGNDDIRIRYGTACKITDVITSPEGSIGIYYEDTDGGELARFAGENVTANPKTFFSNVEGLEIVIGETTYYEYSSTVPTMLPCLDIVKITPPVASIFGEGSFSMIVSLVALIASGISIFLIVDMKKKLVPATANNTEENEDEE